MLRKLFWRIYIFRGGVVEKWSGNSAVQDYDQNMDDIWHLISDQVYCVTKWGRKAAAICAETEQKF